MSGGNRLHDLTVRGWLIAAILLCPIPLSAQEAPPDQKAAGQEASEKPAAPQEAPPSAPLENQRPAEPPCGERCRAAEERDEADLKAQQSMAKAAFWMNWAAWGQVGIGFLGLLLLGVTARFAYRAAVAAEQTVVEANAATQAARRGASAAQDAVTQARQSSIQTIEAMDDNAERQLRAYVFVDSASRIQPPTMSAPQDICLTIKNSGQTPAYNVSVRVTKGIFEPFVEPDLCPADEIEASHTAPLAGGDTMDIRLVLVELDRLQLAKFNSGRAVIYLWGRIDYVDGFKKARFTEFQMINADPRLASFAYCKEGNNAS